MTGSGKTAAFAFPILNELAKDTYGVFALVMTPSRELAYQLIEQFVAFGAPIGVKTAIAIGGVPHAAQLDAIQQRAHIVVATPGRLKFLLESFMPEIEQCTRYLRFLVLDEADRLLEGDMRCDTLACIGHLPVSRAPQGRRTYIFSATVTSELRSVDGDLLPRLGIQDRESLFIALTSDAVVSASVLDGGGQAAKDGTADEDTILRIPSTVEQTYLFTPPQAKLPYLVLLLKSREAALSAIIFTNSCFRCEVVRLSLQLLGFPVGSLNSLLTQQQRLDQLAMFKAGITKFLVATDVAARGLDIPIVDMVVHFDFPKLSSAYVHRTGRTGRAQRAGLCVSIVTDHDLYLVHKLERRTKSKLVEYQRAGVSDEELLKVLDEVSQAKVEAKLLAQKRYGQRTLALKSVADERRSDMNRAIRHDGGMQRPTSGRSGGGNITRAQPPFADTPSSPAGNGSSWGKRRRDATE